MKTHHWFVLCALAFLFLCMATVSTSIRCDVAEACDPQTTVTPVYRTTTGTLTFIAQETESESDVTCKPLGRNRIVCVEPNVGARCVYRAEPLQPLYCKHANGTICSFDSEGRIAQCTTPRGTVCQIDEKTQIRTCRLADGAVCYFHTKSETLYVCDEPNGLRCLYRVLKDKSNEVVECRPML